MPPSINEPIFTGASLSGQSGTPLLAQSFHITSQSANGHLYQEPTVHNHDHSRSALGNCAIMASTTPDRLLPGETRHTPSSRGNSPRQNGDTSPHRGEVDEIPDNYEIQRPEFFEIGRILQIWAPGSRRKQRRYVLLDTEAVSDILCLEVHGHEHTHGHHGHHNHRSGGHDHNHDPAFLDKHIIIQAYKSERPGYLQEDDEVLYLNRRTTEKLTEELWVHLGHADSINFQQHYCTNVGILDRDSVHTLRVSYVNWLTQRWRLPKIRQ